MAVCAALGAGAILGASGLVVYQRLRDNVGLKVTGSDFSQEIASLTTHIERLRLDIESLKGVNLATRLGEFGSEIDLLFTGKFCLIEVTEESRKPLKSVLKKSSRYEGGEEDVTRLDLPESNTSSTRSRHRRNQSWGSGLTSGSASSSGTEYFSAVSDDEEDFLTPPDMESLLTGPVQAPVLGYDHSDLVELFARLDDLMEGSQEQQQLALKMITDSLKEHNNNPSFLWRLCKAQYLNAVLAGQDGAGDIKKDLITEAVQSGQRALDINQDISEAHKWYAISLGSRGEFQGVKEKILDGFEFKKHIDRAAELNPGDHITHHLLGRFCYEVSQVTLGLSFGEVNP